MFPSPGVKLDSSPVIAHMGSCAEPVSSQPLRLPIRLSLRTLLFACAWILVLPDVISVLLIPLSVPLPGCNTPALPLSSLAYIGLTIAMSCLAYNLPLLQFLQGKPFPSCSNSLMFRPRYLLGSLIAPTVMVSC
jgi:hypothetical protein